MFDAFCSISLPIACGAAPCFRIASFRGFCICGAGCCKASSFSDATSGSGVDTSVGVATVFASSSWAGLENFLD